MKKRIWMLILAVIMLTGMCGMHVMAVENVTGKITEVTQESRIVLPDGRTQYVYSVTGTGLKEVGVVVHKSVNSKFKTSMYEVEREGEGDLQKVIVTFATWDKLDEIFENQIKGFIRFYPTTTDMNMFNYEAQLNIKLNKDEAPTASEQAKILTVAASPANAYYANGVTEVTVTGEALDAANLEVNVDNADVGAITGNDTELRFAVTFPNNVKVNPVEYEISVNIKGQDDKYKVTVTVNGVNTITGKEALEHPEHILDVRAEATILKTGGIREAKQFPQFPMEDRTLDAKMQEFAEVYKGNNDPIYVMCNSGFVGAPRATKNLLAAGIEPERIFTILKGAGDSDIRKRFEDLTVEEPEDTPADTPTDTPTDAPTEQPTGKPSEQPQKPDGSTGAAETGDEAKAALWGTFLIVAALAMMSQAFCFKKEEA